MKIEDLIKQVNDYFVNKVIEGDYKFIQSGEHTATILIDDTYSFRMWIANGRDFFSFYQQPFPIDSTIEFDFKNRKDKHKAWTKINIYLKEIDRIKLKSEKQKEINRLQKEIEKLDKD